MKCICDECRKQFELTSHYFCIKKSFLSSVEWEHKDQNNPYWKDYLIAFVRCPHCNHKNNLR